MHQLSELKYYSFSKISSEPETSESDSEALGKGGTRNNGEKISNGIPTTKQGKDLFFVKFLLHLIV